MPTDATGLSRLERTIGNFDPDRFMWKLRLVRAYHPMIPLRGRQGLFDVDLEAA